MQSLRFGLLKTHAPYLQFKKPGTVQTNGDVESLGTFMVQGETTGDGFKARFYGNRGNVEVAVRGNSLNTPATFSTPEDGCSNNPGFWDRFKARDQVVLQQYTLDLKYLVELNASGELD